MSNQWFESVAVAQRRAKRHLPKSVYSALIAGSEAGVTLEDNLAAFRELGFAPHVGGASAQRDQTTTVMGEQISLPVMISPTGVQSVHPDGELAVARAAAARGTAMGLSSFASKPVEDVVAANPQTFFQLYWAGGREQIAARIDRARAAGVRGLIVTLDWSFSHSRDWGSPKIPEKMDLKTAIRFLPEALIRPQWFIDWTRAGGPPDLTVPNMSAPGAPAPTFFGAYGEWMMTPPPSWEDLRWLRGQWDGPFMLKGVMRVDDARRAVGHRLQRDLGLQPRRQQPRRHPGLDPRAAGDCRGGRRTDRRAARRRDPAWRRRGEGAGPGRQGGDDRKGLPVGARRRRARPGSRTCSTSCAPGSTRRCSDSAARALPSSPRMT